MNQKILEELLKPRTVFALMFYATYVILMLRGLPIPGELSSIVHVLMGFYFGQRARKINGNKPIV